MYLNFILCSCVCFIVVKGGFQENPSTLIGNVDFPAHVKFPIVNSSLMYRGYPEEVVKVNKIHDSHQRLKVHWIGGKSGIVIYLAENPDKRNPAIEKSHTTVFISYDNGDTYENKTETFKTPDGKYAILDKLYYHPNNRTHLVITDVRYNLIFLSKDHGKTFEAEKLIFTPNEVSLHETKPSTFLVLDKTDTNNHQLWVTEDFGKSFRLAVAFVISFYWLKNVEENYQLIVQKLESDNDLSSVIYSDDLFSTREHIHSTKVKDLFFKKGYLFTTRFNAEGNLALYASYKLGEQQLCVFDSDDRFLNYFIVDVTESRILIAAFYKINHSTLYVSKYLRGVNGEILFYSSLKNVYGGFPFPISRTSRLTKGAYVEVHKVKGLTGIYIANKIISDPEHLVTVITFDYGDTWHPIVAPTKDSAGKLTKCWLSSNCSLHLTQTYDELSPARIANIVSSKSAPGIIVATGTCGRSTWSGYGYDVYISQDAGITWYQALQGRYHYKIGDHGGIIAAVENNETRLDIGNMKYSTNGGHRWREISFHDKGLKVYELLAKSEEDTIFTISGFLPAIPLEWIVVKIDLKSIFYRTCNELDYEMQTPGKFTEASVYISCTLGQQTFYERRWSSGNCTYGTDYIRNISIKSCDCDVYDFECDTGFISTTIPPRCVLAEPLHTYDPYKIPSDCKPGQFYNRTRGYRKMPGNVCVDGFESNYMPNIIPCPSKKIDDLILLANRDNILRYHLGTRKLEELTIKNFKYVNAIDFDMSSNCLYFADMEEHKIGRQCLNDDSPIETLLSMNLSSIEGIALDWISKTIYFVDGGSRKIELINTNVNHSGPMRRTILNSTILHNPRGIALHPQAGYMFWTDLSFEDPSVNRANLDGSEAESLFGEDEVLLPNAITIDYISDMIYWVDGGMNYIGRSDLEGFNFLKVVSEKDLNTMPYAIAVFKNGLYWDDWKKKCLVSADIDNFNGANVILKQLSMPSDLKVFAHGMQIGTNKCSNSPCSHICVGLPQNNLACLCPNALIMRDGKCICREEDHFLCSNDICIPEWRRCDGANDCGDSSDEEQCHETSCPASSFICDDGRCLPSKRRCDRNTDCDDKSDEMGCPETNKCQRDEFSCKNGHCINMSWKCDSVKDCEDGSDEMNCGTAKTCERDEFQCKSDNTSCIPFGWRCDEKNDCPDNSDESHCPFNLCPNGFFDCGFFEPTCVREAGICNGIMDCINGEDEANCAKTTTKSPKTKTATKSPITKSSTKASKTTKLRILSNNLHDSHLRLMIHWVGGKSGVVICLAETPPETKIPGIENTHTSVFISYDDGDTYNNKTGSFKTPDGKYAIVDKLYYHPNNRTHLVITDVRHNLIFLTNDHGKTFEGQKIIFTPNEVSFHKANPSTFLVLDKTNANNQQLWATEEFGKTFRLAVEFVKSFYWLKNADEYYQLIVQKVESNNDLSSVIYSKDLFRSEEHIHSTGVKDVFFMKDYLFTTIINAEGNLNLYASYKLGKQLLCVFDSGNRSLNYFIVDVTDSRILIAVFYTNKFPTLYVSEDLGGIKGEIRFYPSLEEVFGFFPSLNARTSWLTKEAYVEVHKVKGLAGIYIANQIFTDAEHMETVITFDYGDTWRSIPAPRIDSQGNFTHCWVSAKCSLHFTQTYDELSPAGITNILSSESAPGIILATGTYGRSTWSGYGYDVYISKDAGVTWRQTLKGSYYYAMGDHGSIIAAVENNKSRLNIGNMKYSIDGGDHWEDIISHDKELKVYELLAKSEENTIFTISGFLPTTPPEWIVVKIDLKSIFNRTCSELDYEMQFPGRITKAWEYIPCTPGQQKSYERRLSHANCMYGTDYIRKMSTKSCYCDVFDYECDSGFLSTGTPHRCILAEPLTTYDPYKIPSDCKPGQFYNRTRGYRKIPGNVCVDGFESHYMPNIIPCPSKEIDDFLLLANGDNVLKYHFDTRKLEEISIKNFKYVNAIDFDMSSNCLYFADKEEHKIGRQCLNNDSQIETLLSMNVSSIEGIAIDWISKTLYIVDGGSNKIELINTNMNHSGLMRRTILNSTVLGNPRGIALHPQAGYMFWTDPSVKYPSVNRANLDGTEYEVLFGENDVGMPIGITIDYIADRIYWVDEMKNYIGSSDLYGVGFLKVVSNNEFVTYPYAIVVFKNDLYWNDWINNYIVSADKDNFKGANVILKQLSRPRDLKVFAHGMQIGTNKCSNSPCPYICVGLPQNDFACLCPDGLIMRDKKCICPDEEHFVCSNGRCVPERQRCDGANDCGDSSDEEHCHKTTSLPSSFVCDDENCISNEQRCDHNKDCKDGLVEMGCPESNCCTNEFSCENGHCINMSWKCDGAMDCGDGSDEINCRTAKTCESDEFQCKSGNKSCIPLSWRCNAINDCPDNSDESDCSFIPCPIGFINCGPLELTCVRAAGICNGIKDCISGADEVNCTKITTEPSKMTTATGTIKTTITTTESPKTPITPITTTISPKTTIPTTKSSKTPITTTKSPKTTITTRLPKTTITTTGLPITTTGLPVTTTGLPKTTITTTKTPQSRTITTESPIIRTPKESPIKEITSTVIPKIISTTDTPKTTPTKESSKTTKLGRSLINNLHDSHLRLMVHWVGEKSGVVICFAKNPEPKNPASKRTESAVFISYDDGGTYENKTESFKTPDGKSATLDKLYYHLNTRSHLVFTDVRHNLIFPTKDYGKTFEVQKLNFTPNEVSFHKTKPSTFLVLDKSFINHQLWVTEDFGETFRLAAEFVKSFYWLENFDENYHLLVQKVESNGLSSVIYSDNLFTSKGYNRSTKVKDFFIVEDYLFTTIFNAEGNLALYASYKLGKQLLCVFDSGERFLDFFVVDVTDSRILIAVSHSNIASTLYVSEDLGGIDGIIRFNSSLENVFAFFPSITFRHTWLTWTSKEAFVDVHKVEGLTGIYIASKISKLNKNHLVSMHLKTLITFDYGATWRPIPAPQTDSTRQSTDCWLSNNCSLHLAQKFNELSPVTKTTNIYSSKSAPGIIVATGNLGDSMNNMNGYGIYISKDAGLTWRQTLQGRYYYKIGDHGGIIAAVENYKTKVTTRNMKYSTDEGEHWQEVNFHDEGLKLYELMTKSEEDTIFIMSGFLPARQLEWIVVKIDLKSMFSRTCSEHDFEMWPPGPSSENRSYIPYTPGQQKSYKRRLPNANCMIGTAYNVYTRNNSKKSCDVLDYECDTGFLFTGTPHRCILANSLNTYDPYKIPSDCKPGQFYNRTKGYRKIPGHVCDDGFESQYIPDIIPCPFTEVDDFFLLANGDNILRYNFVTRKLDELPIKLANVSTIDFDMSSNCLYFANKEEHKIGRQCLNDDSPIETLLSMNVSSIEGISLDWISKTLYFVDGVRSKIELIKTNVNLSGFMRRTILNSTVLRMPRGIALHPQAGYMFWTDLSFENPSINRANLDGTEIKILFGKDKVERPNGITIDYMASRIYWVDARKDYIGSSDLHGGGFLKVVSHNEFVTHPYAIAVLKNDLYWVDWKKKSVVSGDKDNFKGANVILKQLSMPSDLKVFAHGMQIGANKCSYSSCSYICVGLPQNNFACLCPDRLIMRDKKCVCPDEGHFVCSNNRCIPERLRCDGANDCGDLSDEEQCPKPTCPASSFVCDDGYCLPSNRRCDRNKDCDDGSDEMGCPESNCHADEFACENGHCINMSWKCDGAKDCGDGSDEMNCGTAENCKSDEFQCKSGNKSCIPLSSRCDAKNDCSDNSDELDCSIIPCPIGFINCGPLELTCVREAEICNGIKNCISGADEVNCPITTTQSPKTKTATNSPKTKSETNSPKVTTNSPSPKIRITTTESPKATTATDPPKATTATDPPIATTATNPPKTTTSTDSPIIWITSTENPKTTPLESSDPTGILRDLMSGSCKSWMFLCNSQYCGFKCNNNAD